MKRKRSWSCNVVCGRVRCLQDVYSIGGYADGQLKNTEGVEIKEKEGVVYIDDYQPARTRSEQPKSGE